MTADESAGVQPWSNGLHAPSYVPLTDVSAADAGRILLALRRSRIAAYLVAPDGTDGVVRLYVAAAERSDARFVVLSVIRGQGGEPPADAGGAPTAPDPLAGVDADAAFAALVADWHVDTHEAIRAAERDLNREDEDWRLRLQGTTAHPSTERTDAAEDDLWLDDEHFVPPNPPPIPRPTLAVALSLVLIAVSVVLLGFGNDLGLPNEASLLLGVTGVLTATAVLIMRLRAYRDEDDDGAVV